ATPCTRSPGLRSFSPLAGGMLAIRHPGCRKRGMLTRGERGLVEIVDQLVEQAIPVDLGLQGQKHRAKPDCSAVHEDEFTRRSDPAKSTNVAMHALGHRSAVDAARLF